MEKINIATPGVAFPFSHSVILLGTLALCWFEPAMNIFRANSFHGHIAIIRLLSNTFEPHVTNTQDSIFCQVLWLFVGADPNTCDDEGRSALYLMIDQGGANPVILKELLKAGASPNKATWSLQQTPLHVAARRGYQVWCNTNPFFMSRYAYKVMTLNFLRSIFMMKFGPSSHS